MTIKRGDIFFVKATANTGSEQKAGRPAIVVSNNFANTFSSVVEVVFLTSKNKKSLPTHAKIHCRVESVALCEQITSVSKERLGKYVKSCSDLEIKDVNRALKVSLGLNEVIF